MYNFGVPTTQILDRLLRSARNDNLFFCYCEAQCAVAIQLLFLTFKEFRNFCRLSLVVVVKGLKILG